MWVWHGFPCWLWLQLHQMRMQTFIWHYSRVCVCDCLLGCWEMRSKLHLTSEWFLRISLRGKQRGRGMKLWGNTRNKRLAWKRAVDCVCKRAVSHRHFVSTSAPSKKALKSNTDLIGSDTERRNESGKESEPERESWGGGTKNKTNMMDEFTLSRSMIVLIPALITCTQFNPGLMFKFNQYTHIMT